MPKENNVFYINPKHTPFYYVTMILDRLCENEVFCREIVLKGMGKAIPVTIDLAEILCRRPEILCGRFFSGFEVTNVVIGSIILNRKSGDSKRISKIEIRITHPNGRQFSKKKSGAKEITYVELNHATHLRRQTRGYEDYII